MEPIEVKIDISKYTPTELMLEVQKLSFKDPEINEKLCAALRKIADGIQNRKVGVTSIATEVIQKYDSFPGCKITLEFSDQEQLEKQNEKLKRKA